MSNDVDAFLAHYGVKGMKWGVRRDVGHEGEKATTKKIAKLDKKYEKSFSGMGGYAKVTNAIADKINPRLDAMNSKPEYQVDMTKNPSVQKKYLAEYESHMKKSLQDVMSDFGTNASGTRRLSLTTEGSGYEINWVASFEDIQHAAGDDRLRIIPKFNARGQIVSQTFETVDSELAHYGVKGMRWGKRKGETYTQAIRRSRAELKGKKRDLDAAKTNYKQLKKTKDAGAKAAREVLKKAKKDYRVTFDTASAYTGREFALVLLTGGVGAIKVGADLSREIQREGRSE